MAKREITHINLVGKSTKVSKSSKASSKVKKGARKKVSKKATPIKGKGKGK